MYRNTCIYTLWLNEVNNFRYTLAREWVRKSGGRDIIVRYIYIYIYVHGYNSNTFRARSHRIGLLHGWSLKALSPDTGESHSMNLPH